VQPVTVDHDDELILGDEIQLNMAFSTPEKLECYAAGRKLPSSLNDGVLLHETDFSFTFSVAGEDLAFYSKQNIRY